MSLAWCAGLFDGEGNITASQQAANRYATLYLRLVMNDERTVRRFRELVGVGSVLRSPPRGVRAASWTWGCYNRRDQLRVLHALLPHLVAKERDARLALWFLEAFGGPMRQRRQHRVLLALRSLKTKPGNRR